MIALIDYGAGNLTSVKKALTALDAPLFIPKTPSELAAARGIIVPGVGNFGTTRALKGAWTEAIRTHAGGGRPLLGICLGMQWLFHGSDESPDVSGLGIFAGRCHRLGHSARKVKIPHVGWNDIQIKRDASIVRGVSSGAQVYFTHSYAVEATPDTIAVTEHGETFAAIVQRESIAGIQFHPEKSGEIGLRILRNFIELVT